MGVVRAERQQLPCQVCQTPTRLPDVACATLNVKMRLCGQCKPAVIQVQDMVKAIERATFGQRTGYHIPVKALVNNLGMRAASSPDPIRKVIIAALTAMCCAQPAAASGSAASSSAYIKTMSLQGSVFEFLSFANDYNTGNMHKAKGMATVMLMVMTIIYVVVWTVTRNSPYSSNNNMNIENGKKSWICDREFSADGIAYGTATIYLDDQWHMKCGACSQYVRSRKILGV